MTARITHAAQRISSCIAYGSLLILAGVANAVEIEAEFNVGVGASDNVGQAAANEVEETIGVTGINFGLTEDSRRLTADIRSRFDYTYYFDDTFDSEWVGGFDGTVDVVLLEERLTWLIQDNFGQQTSNPFAAAGPNNREDVNFFTTGPTINLLTGGRNVLQIDLRYSSVDFEVQDTDNERKSVALRMGREIRRGVELSLIANIENVEFDDGGLSQDFDRSEEFLRYEINGSRNTVGADVGYTEIDIQGTKSDGMLVRLDWSRQVSADTTFLLSGGTSFSDQGDIFRFDQDSATDLRDTADVIPSAVPFTSNFVTASYTIGGSRTSINIGITWREEDYVGGPPIDRNTTGANFSLRREVSRSMFAGFSAQYRRRNFKYLNTADDNVRVSAEFGYTFSQSFRTSLQYNYFERSGDTAVAVSRENRLFLRLFYTPAWGR